MRMQPARTISRRGGPDPLRAVRVACRVMMLGLLCILLVGERAYQTAYQTRSLLSNLALLPMALAGVAGLGWLRRREGSASGKRGGRFPLAIYFALLLVVQLIVVRSVWFYVGLDPVALTTTAQELADGMPPTYAIYYEIYPNNAALTVVYAAVLFMAGRLGLSVPYVTLIYLNAVLMNLSALLCCLCVRRLTQSRVARGFALGVATVWIALSPFVMYPYSDTCALLFPVLAFYVWLRIRRPVLRRFAFTLACFAGACVKPTVLVVWLAAALIDGARFACLRGRRPWKRAGAAALACVLASGCYPLIQGLCLSAITGEARSQRAVSLPHFLMMGMNGETLGGYSEEDLLYSLSFPDGAERSRAGLARAWERVRERGVGGNLDFFLAKAYKAYADGSIASNRNFPELSVPRKRDALSTLIRSIYHTRGEWNPVFNTVNQGLWLMLLLLCAAGAVRWRTAPCAVVSLTHIGLLLYQLLMECAPRYLFLFTPFFVILAAMALDEPFRLNLRLRNKAPL